MKLQVLKVRNSKSSNLSAQNLKVSQYVTPLEIRNYNQKSSQGFSSSSSLIMCHFRVHILVSFKNTSNSLIPILVCIKTGNEIFCRGI